METMDLDDKRPRSGSYGSHNASRLPSTDPSLHNYPPYSSAGHPLPGPAPSYQHPHQHQHQHSSWVPPPSPYNGNRNDQRSAQEPAQHQVSNAGTYGAHRTYATHGPDPPYSRQGSTSAPSRSPIDTPHQSQHAQLNGHEPHHSNHHVPAEPAPRHGFAPHEPSGTGNQPHGLPSFSGNPEIMSNPASAPSGLPQYAAPAATAAPGAPSYDHGPYPYSIQGYANQQARRKPVRASQACDTCRARKAKCDEGRPCGHCRDNNLDCQYRELPIPKQDRHVRDQMEKLELILRRLDGHEQKLEKLQQSLHMSHSDQKTANSVSSLSTPHSVLLQDPVYESKEMSQSSPADLSHQRQRHDRQSSQPVASSEARSGELTIPLRHSTYAHKLLEWPAIARYLKKFGFNERYVNDSEQRRPVTRPYGRGAGEEKSDLSKGPSSPADSASSRSDDQDSPPSLHGAWGIGLYDPLPVTDSPDHIGGQKSDGTLNLDEAVIEKCFQVYMKDIHILQPFLNRRVLHGMIHKFKRRYSPGASLLDYRLGGSGRKRKHTDDHSSMERSATRQSPYLDPNSPYPDRGPFVEHSLSNAIILLILALGKICSTEEKLRGPVADAYPSPSSIPSHTSPSTSLGTRNQLSPGYHEAMRSPPNLYERSSTTSAHSPPHVKEKRNLDVIPGLAYYSVAINILAEHLGENSIEEVQACILASLYAGQRAHVAQSHKWIGLACNACQIMINADLHREKMPNEPSHSRNSAEALKFAYWTCLQLESDILAEIDLPPSGITRSESMMYNPDDPQMPKGYVTEDNMGASEDELFFYSTQIHLRIRLNQVHTELYQETQKDLPNLKALMDNVSELDKSVREWRRILGENTTLKWDDSTFQDGRINVVRMRAKFYGSIYVIHRPILHKVLHDPSLISGDISESPISTPGRTSSMGTSPAATHTTAPKRTPSQMPPPDGPLSSRVSTRVFENLSDTERIKLQETLRQQCKTCIEAAKKSTEVFDNIKGRLTITNIFGTAHAQFGNVLVLSATYMSKDSYLSSLVDLSDLKRLLNRTIRFLRRYDETSPTLKTDAEILTVVRDEYVNPNSRSTPVTSLPSTSSALSRSF